MIKSEENAKRRGVRQRKTGPFYFADFSPFQFAGDTVFYQWRKQFLESAALAFSSTDKAQARQTKRLIAELEHRIQKKDSVIAELMEEYTNLKKKNGVR